MSSFFRGDDDRRNRLSQADTPPVGPDLHGSTLLNGTGNGGNGSTANEGTTSEGVPSLRERAASQPPRVTADSPHQYFSSPSTQHYIPSTSPWSSHRIPNSNNNNNNNNNNGGGNGSGASPQPVPIRSSSFSAQFSSSMQTRRRIPSTFEDDEDADLDNPPLSSASDHFSIGGGGDDRYDPYDPYHPSASLSHSLTRGRTTYGHDPSRSRSQSLATFPHRSTNPPIGSGGSPSLSSGFLRTPTMQSWNESLLSSLASPSSGGRYDRYEGNMGGNRYASLRTLGVSASRIHDSSSPSSSSSPFRGVTPPSSSSLSSNRYHDVSNVSPFVRDVGEILLDSSGLWGTGAVPGNRDNRDGENASGFASGTTSGTTSRRHSVSVVQPRTRPGNNSIVGFNAPGVGALDSDEQPVNTRSSHLFHHHYSSSPYGSSILGGGTAAATTTTTGGGGGGTSSSGSYYGNVTGPGSTSNSGRGGGTGSGSSGADAGGGMVGIGGRSLLLTDEDLADDLGLLNINANEPPPPSSIKFPPSQPSSLPIFNTSRSPVSATRDTTSPYRGLGLGTTGGSGAGGGAVGGPTTNTSNGGGGNSYFSITTSTAAAAAAASLRPQRQQRSTPSDDYNPDSPQLGVQFDSASSSSAQKPQQLYSTENVKSPFVSVNTQLSSASGYAGGGPTSPLSPTGAGIVSGLGAAGAGLSTSPTASRLLVNPQQQPYYAHQRRVSETHGMTSPTSGPSSAVSPPPTGIPTCSLNLNDLGKGIPLRTVPSSYPLYIVEFKAGRTDLYYLSDPKLEVRLGDLVIVEADRGRDLGKVVNEGITVREVEAWQRQQAEKAQAQAQAMAGMGFGLDGQPTSPIGGQPPTPGTGKKEISPKMIYAKAGPHETQMLATKTQDEHKALQLCQTKVRAKKLPMEVVDAEYQWDRRKLTFYFVAEKRIDFRELVRELFRLYKTRIWMASLQGPGGYEQ